MQDEAVALPPREARATFPPLLFVVDFDLVEARLAAARGQDHHANKGGVLGGKRKHIGALWRQIVKFRVCRCGQRQEQDAP